MESTKHTKAKKQKSLTRTNTPQILTSLFLIIFGAAILVYVSFQNVNFVTIPKPPVNSQSTNQSLPKPTKLYIPKMQKILYVSDGFVQNDKWVIAQTGVSFLTSSAVPGQNGNSVIYGHNTKDILGGLWRVQNGDFIYVVLQDGQFVKYEVFERKEISPTQVEILKNTDDSRLTIYTCSGTLDTARFVIIAQKVQAS